MKTCFKCKQAKELSEFYRHPRMADGHLGKCRECTKSDVHQNYVKRRVQYSEYDKERTQRPERKANMRRYIATKKARNPLQAKAWMAVYKAVRSGRLKRQPCSKCGSEEHVQAHHHDYTKPLDIVWECFRCHRETEHGQVVTQWRPKDR
jgi:hypothetical protein